MGRREVRKNVAGVLGPNVSSITPSRVALEPAYILHSRPYRETSKLLHVFTATCGKRSLLVKGVRTRKSNLAGILQPFNRLRVSWSGKTDLQVMTDAELVASLNLVGNRLFCGFYLNELVERFTENHDPHYDLFVEYGSALERLAGDCAVELTLRSFESRLLQETGYGMQLEYEADSGERIVADKWYNYQLGRGPVSAEPGISAVRGATLIGLRNNSLEDTVALREAKRLMRAVIDYHLAGRPLRSRRLFRGSGTANADWPNSDTGVETRSK